MTWVYCATIVLGSCLLFLVQPMCAKKVLPLLGGTPAVWNTCMVFFQAGLLAGYAYAHVLPLRLGLGRHALLHLVVLIAAFFLLPIALPEEVPSGWHPVLWLLASLAWSVGLPFVLLAAAAPLLQRWYFMRVTTGKNRDPYVLYSASNVGSLLGLALFPIVFEPFFTLPDQAEVWRWAFAALILLTAFCVPWHSMSAPPIPVEMPKASPALTWRQRGRWVMLALIPSSLLLSVTSHLTTDIAAIPLLWLIPMGLYLLTFTIVFAQNQYISPAILKRWLPLVVIVMLLVILTEATEPLLLVLGIHLVGFVWLAFACHGELARTRPAADRLTDFYLCLALGGVLGGAFNALVAPVLFLRFAEYPLMIALACAFGLDQGTRPKRADWLWAAGLAAATGLVVVALQTEPDITSQMAKGVFVAAIGLPLLFCYLQQKFTARFALCIGAVALAGSLLHGPHGVPLHRERSYYGIHRVTRIENIHRLVHGNIAHGQQQFDEEDASVRREPLTYYSKTGPIGDLFAAYAKDARLKKVGLVGLGSGSLAAYSELGQEWTFFELDPSVQRIAENPHLFTYLSDAKGKIRIELGDARQQLQKSADKFGLLVIDAFGSDAIPVHLLTREAFALYHDRLMPDGLMAFHISNNYVDLEPVLANLAADAKPACIAYLRHHAVDPAVKGAMSSTWMVIARRDDDFAPLLKSGNWRPARTKPQQRVWTDDYSNLLQVFRWRGP